MKPVTSSVATAESADGSTFTSLEQAVVRKIDPGTVFLEPPGTKPTRIPKPHSITNDSGFPESESEAIQAMKRPFSTFHSLPQK